MLDFIFNAFLISCIVWTYHTILKDYLLSRWFLLGWKYLGKDDTKFKYHFYKLIFECENCLSGQLAFWLFFYLFSDYNIFLHIGFIALTILITRIIFYGQQRISD